MGRKKHASPEQLEFYFCRIEMEKELTKSHQDVERVVGECGQCLFVGGYWNQSVCLLIT